MERRFTPVAVCLGLAVAALLARLWDIQVLEHEIWAQESANLVRSSEVEPYVRGTLFDRNGRAIVRDEKTYSLEFVWRDFRRGHPLGQVAMLRSLALMRPIGLDEARISLREAALGYVSLSPDDIEEFARGAALDARVDYVPAVLGASAKERRAAARAERRLSRARDLRFYISRMLQLSRAESKRLRRLVAKVDGASARTYMDLVGEVTDQSTDDVAESLVARVMKADYHLMQLAGLIDWEAESAGTNTLRTMASGDRLVELIERQRRAVEGDAADALFSIATGFSPTRLDERNLAALDLDWLRIAMDWNGDRMREWRASRGSLFAAEALTWMAGHTIARTKIESGFHADRILSAVAHAFRRDADAWTRRNAAPEDWRQVNELDVLDYLPERLRDGGDIRELATEPLLVMQDPGLRTAGIGGADLLVSAFPAALEQAAAEETRVRAQEASASGKKVPRATTTEQVAMRLIDVAADAQGDWSREHEAIVASILVDENERVQRRVARVFNQLNGGGDDVAPLGSIAINELFVEKALETRAHVIRDRGARSKVVGGEPEMELVLLVSRYADVFAGFAVTSKTTRVSMESGPDEETPLADKLIGRVRSPFLVEVLSQRPDMAELAQLRRKLRLPKKDEQSILKLVDKIYRAGEVIGGFGIEAWFDKELSGKDGYSEFYGLQDQVDGNRAPIYRGARDGQDVTLTLDIDLQRAAESVLFAPEMPPRNDIDVDELWFNAPVGAIVMATVEGEILAAASVPVRAGLDVPRFTDGQRAYAHERALGRPLAQAPGSVVKPLMAAYALQHLDLDGAKGLFHCDHERQREGVSPKQTNKPGWGSINCNVTYGHSREISGRPLDLKQALKRSCNVYFAALGELHYNEDSMRSAYELFGFGRPTGVRFDDNGNRQGLVDSSHFAKSSSLRWDADAGPGPRSRQSLGNGLTVIDVNVVQVARAYAGLATGELPEMSLVKAIGETTIPHRSVSLGIDEIHLEFIREALDDVVNSRRGTAHKKGLEEDDLHFRIAAKTGSADYHMGEGLKRRDGRQGEPKPLMRKHTWIAGWFPADDPKFVFVAYCHDTSATAGHSAAYVASQFLKRPEVLALVEALPASAETDSIDSEPASTEGAPR